MYISNIWSFKCLLLSNKTSCKKRKVNTETGEIFVNLLFYKYDTVLFTLLQNRVNQIRYAENEMH